MRLLATGPGKIDVTLLNPAGKPEVYVGQANTVTLQLTNNTGSAIAIQPGAPVNPPPESGPLVIDLYFKRFFATVAEQSALQISATDWTARFFGPPDPYPAWALARDTAYTWNDKETLSFKVANLTPTVSLGTYYLTVVLSNAGTTEPITASIPIGVSNAPKPGNQDLTQVVGLQVLDNKVTITKNPDEPVKGQLKITMYNKRANAPVVASDVPWKSKPPTFTLSFAYAPAPGYFALTTQELAAKFSVGLGGGSAGWKQPAIDEGPVWRYEPLESNHAVLGTGTAGVVEFVVDNLVTQLAPGPAVVYLQYTDVPGYDDGFLTYLLDKQYAQMTIDSFKINQQVFPVDGQNVSYGYLNWQVSHSTLVEVEQLGPVPSKAQRQGVPIEYDQTIVLTAFDAALGDVQTASIPVRVEPALSKRWVPCGTIALWSGAVSEIPHGWALCDGTAGTPDLRDRFVVAAGGQYQPGQSGGEEHTHRLDGLHPAQAAATNGAPTHTHGFPTNWYARGYTSPYPFQSGSTAIDTSGNYSSGTQTQAGGAHSHTVPIDFPAVRTGNPEGRLRPRWYALCYVMKLFP